MKRIWPWIIVAVLAAIPAAPNPAKVSSTGVATPRPVFVLANRGSLHAAPDLQHNAASAGLSESKPATASAVSITHVRGRAGFWTLGQDSTGVWWFVSPQGKPEFLNSVTTVQPVVAARMPRDEHFVSGDWDGTQKGLGKWAAAAWKRVHAVGFKGVGAWSNAALHNVDAPMTQDLNIWPCVGPYVRLYDPQWASTADRFVRAMVAPLAGNRNLVGYYLDNELDWDDPAAGPASYFDHLPAANPNRKQVVAVIRRLWPTAAEFNRDWQTQVTDPADLEQWTSLPREPAGTYSRLASAWLSQLAGDYFRTAATLVRTYDPNHLILGIRYKGYAPREVVAASRDWVDAQSINYYAGDAVLDRDLFQMIHDVSNQPIIISEYTFHALDGTSGDRDNVRFTAQVPDQLARAEGYTLFTERLARVPYIVGADWFQWSDEPPTGRADGEDVNFGIVDIHDRAYPLLADAVARTAPMLDPLHQASNHDDQSGVWRESFANVPVMHVPYLATPPQFRGELADWSQASRLPGVRRSQTVGLERSTEANPSVYLGWNHGGLYMGLQVFNDNVAGATGTDSWSSRDYAEFWFSTRPVTSNQDAYNSYCHEFFFVPGVSPSAPAGGVVGQLHHAGDALKSNLIPDLAVQDIVRILPDRYVLQFFIPAASLSGFDPVNQPSMAFNMHVHNFLKAQDYFWSAPKSIHTQDRPGTWGTLYLEPPPTQTVARTDQTLLTPAQAEPADRVRQ